MKMRKYTVFHEEILLLIKNIRVQEFLKEDCWGSVFSKQVQFYHCRSELGRNDQVQTHTSLPHLSTVLLGTLVKPCLDAEEIKKIHQD